MNRRDNSPGRRMHGHAAEAAYLDGEGYPDETYLDADAYPVDPGYRGYSGGRLRPGDVPVGPPRTRPERTVPPRAGFPPRPSRQAPHDQGAFSRPWQWATLGLPSPNEVRDHLQCRRSPPQAPFGLLLRYLRMIPSAPSTIRPLTWSSYMTARRGRGARFAYPHYPLALCPQSNARFVPQRKPATSATSSRNRGRCTSM